MRARLTLPAGAPGTQALVRKFGKRLLYVRYRYDADRNVRFKTAEIIVDEEPWAPRSKPDDLTYVHVRLPTTETSAERVEELGKAIRRLGGAWHEATRSYRLTYAAAKVLHLTDCIVDAAPEVTPIWEK